MPSQTSSLLFTKSQERVLAEYALLRTGPAHIDDIKKWLTSSGCGFLFELANPMTSEIDFTFDGYINPSPSGQPGYSFRYDGDEEFSYETILQLDDLLPDLGLYVSGINPHTLHVSITTDAWPGVSASLLRDYVSCRLANMEVMQKSEWQRFIETELYKLAPNVGFDVFNQFIDSGLIELNNLEHWLKTQIKDPTPFSELPYDLT